VNLLDRLKSKRILAILDNDLDGVGSTIVTEYYIEPISDINFINTAERDMSEFDHVLAKAADIILFVDIAPTLELYENLIGIGKEVIIVDHHLTSYEGLSDSVPPKNYYYDVTRCATKILYDELTRGIRVNRVLDRFVYLVNVYDLFNFTSKDWVEAKGLNNCLYGYVDWRKINTMTNNDKFMRFINVQFNKFNYCKRFFFSDEELNYIKSANDKEQKYFLDAKKKLTVRIDGEGNKYGFFAIPSKVSFVAHRLLYETEVNLDYVIGYSTYKPNNGQASTKVSIRSRENDFNCLTIAEKYGGGGHKPAAGADLKDINLINDLKVGKIHLI
jgi:oligoribonuclease NrnB/cAMP/cGMP phosphodiesterase (DHH superfamily)